MNYIKTIKVGVFRLRKTQFWPKKRYKKKLKTQRKPQNKGRVGVNPKIQEK